MAENERTSKLIKITATLKGRLERIKKNETFNDYISDMLSYFEMLKLDPKSAMLNPTTEVIFNITRSKESVLSRIEDVIKIIKSIENGKIAAISEKMAGVEGLLLGNTTGLTVEQIQELLNKNQALCDEVDRLKNENIRLQRQSLKPESAPDINNNNNIALVIVRRVKQHLAVTNFKKAAQGKDYFISSEYIDMVINDIEGRL